MNLIQKYITVDPKICHGKPTFKGTRIMVWQILDMLREGNTIEEIIKAFPSLTPDHIKAALYYSARVLEERELHPAFLK